MRPSTAALLFFAFALSACAEQRWQKAGAGEASMFEDLMACNKLAQEKAARAGNIGLPPISDPRFGGPTGPSQAEQRLQERQAADACMRAKGYSLVPVGK
jgi:hypothetical protein